MPAPRVPSWSDGGLDVSLRPEPQCGAIGALARFAAATSAGALPEAVRAKAKACLLYGLAVGAAGAGTRLPGLAARLFDGTEPGAAPPIACSTGEATAAGRRLRQRGAAPLPRPGGHPSGRPRRGRRAARRPCRGRAPRGGRGGALCRDRGGRRDRTTNRTRPCGVGEPAGVPDHAALRSHRGRGGGIPPTWAFARADADALALAANLAGGAPVGEAVAV